MEEQILGIEANELKRLRELEEENAAKKIIAYLSLYNYVLKDLITKKVGSCEKK